MGDKKVDVTICVHGHKHAGAPVKKGAVLSVSETIAKWMRAQKPPICDPYDAPKTTGASKGSSG